jgi:amino-acid N-acetyltransferase
MPDPSFIVRPATFRDASAIFQLVRSHPDELVPRSISDILQNIDRFYVADMGGEVVGTVSWGILPELGSARHPSVELKTLAVRAAERGRGAGRALVKQALDRIAELKPEQVIVLTFVPEFFRRFGFAEVPKEKLMHKLYTGCVNCTRFDSPFTCPEIAMAKPMAASGGREE